MKLLDPLIRVFVLTQSLGVTWLREELIALEVGIPLTDACLGEFVRDADAAACGGARRALRYVEEMRRQVAIRARFIQRWTGSDDSIASQDDQSLQGLVRIARKHALPRRWKLSDPVVTEHRRTCPSYWNWTSELDTEALPQS
ncbi:MAG TPA: hypothetical protein VFB37_15810 [Steroidobacteraceae bacterium]|nr:hypothetical protein [Steroidobacteraceae bacterium]